MDKFVYGLIVAILYATQAYAADPGERELVQLPQPMRQHMLANMRDHLLALSEIQQALAGAQFERAAEIAEQRIGMSSLEAHQAAHMAPFMPQKMQDIGTKMHHAASRFAVLTQESAVDGDVRPALAGLAEVTQQCVACHAAFRVQ